MIRILRAPATPAVLLSCGLLLLFGPAQMFDANAPFFYFGAAQIALVLVPLFVLAFVVLAALLSRGGPGLQRHAATLLGGLAVAAWLHSAFFPTPIGPLDGRTIRLPLYEESVGLNLLLCAGLLAAALAAAWRFPVPARRFCAALFAVLAAQAAWIAAADEHPWRGPSAAERLGALSPDKNVLVILLDEFQSDFFPEIAALEPGLADVFDGFTYFPNAVSPGPRTLLSIPAIHSGVPYHEGERLRDTYRRSVETRSFMAGLARSGYDAVLINPILNFCPGGTHCEHEDALVHGRLSALAESAALLVDLALFRIAPDVLKPAIYGDGSWVTRRAFAEDHAMSSNRVLERMVAALRAESARPAVRFLHLFSTHAPIRLDAECRPVTDQPYARRTAIAQDRCALTYVTALLQRLRALNIYDRTAIVILADHGAGMPKDEKSGWMWGAYASPLLLVKPFGARGTMKQSARVVGLTDVAASVCTWTADCRMEAGADIMAEARQPPNYQFYAFFWRHEYWLAESVPILERYEVRGAPADAANWHRIPR